MRKTLVIIAGPTAVGKTDLGIWLAKKFGSVVVSADSRQIYREMYIGTARPTNEELAQVKHFFIANKSIHDYYNAFQYEQEALKLLDKLFKTNNVVFLVGGSGLYIDAIVKGIDDIPTVLPEIREKLSKWFENEGIEKLRWLLEKLDPKYYQLADLNNPMRLLKALEVTIQSAKPYSSFLRGRDKKRPFEIILIGLDMPREELYDRINTRVDKMVQAGLIEEARKLYQFKGVTALKTVGYQELFDYFDGKITKEQAIDLIKRNTRKYARRQLSWFRRYKDIKWFDPRQREEIYNWLVNELGKRKNNGT